MQKKFVVIVCIACAGMILSCNKQSDHSESGYWSLQDKKFDINYTYQRDSLGYFVLVGGDSATAAEGIYKNSISVWFKKKPVQNGSYEIRDIQESAYSLTDDQLAVSGLMENYANPYPCVLSANYSATGILTNFTWPWTPSERAQVSIHSGKIRVEVPATTTVYIACALDSPTLKSVFIEK